MKDQTNIRDAATYRFTKIIMNTICSCVKNKRLNLLQPNMLQTLSCIEIKYTTHCKRIANDKTTITDLQL